MIRPARPEDAEAMARVHLAAWEETYAGIVPPSVLASRTVADRAAGWRQVLSGDAAGPPPVGAAVLDLDGVLAGFGSWRGQRDEGLRAQGYSGEVTTLYLLRTAQGQGWGRALMASAARGLIACGHRGMGLWVLRENVRACAFYDRLGGLRCGEQEDDWGGERVVDVAYGWPSLDALAEWQS